MRTRRPRPAPVPGPMVIVTLTGGAHLQTFVSFGLQAIRRFDPTRGRHCFRGPFLRGGDGRVPPMNEPIPYLVPADAKAVAIVARSAHGPTQDVHAVVVPAEGESMHLPLSIATDEHQRDVARLAHLLQAASWVFARTMPENPHEYTKRETWASAADFEFAVMAIRRYGYRQRYIPPGETRVAYTETVFEAGSHFVWSGWQPPAITGWINRKPLPSPIEPRVVDQTLRIDHARLLDLPMDGLDVSTTPFVRAGYALFGEPTPRLFDLRPRLRKRNGEAR